MLIVIHTDDLTVHENQRVLRSEQPFNIAHNFRFVISFINPYFDVDSEWLTLQSSGLCDVGEHLCRFKAHVVL